MNRQIILTILVVIITLTATAQWNVQMVENVGNSGLNTNILVDSQGNQGILYKGGADGYTLLYSNWNGNSWKSTNVAGGVYGDVSAVIDQGDTIYCVYSTGTYTGSSRGLYYCKKLPGQAWSSPSRLLTGNFYEVSIEYFYDVPNGTTIPHIAYYNGILNHIFFNPQTLNWINEIVDETSGSGVYNDIAIDNDGGIHIAYTGGDSDLKYAFFDNTQWSIIFVDGLFENVGQFSSIEVDSDGVAHISYYDNTNHQLKHATISH
ncbi:MAG TPA: hypothetical protein PLW31_04060 [Bacteroidales bacterium]|nr:hypothetical protein [Bacteroidales bacterium]